MYIVYCRHPSLLYGCSLKKKIKKEKNNIPLPPYISPHPPYNLQYTSMDYDLWFQLDEYNPCICCHYLVNLDIGWIEVGSPTQLK